MHKIPNFALGKVAGRQVTRVFFPALYEPNTSPAISQAIFAAIYDDCLRPTVQSVLPDHQTHWPVSYELAMRQARGVSAKLHHSSIDVPPGQLDDFATIFLEKLDRVPSLQNAFFLHEFRGLKGGSVHQADNPQERVKALDHTLSELIPNVIPIHLVY